MLGNGVQNQHELTQEATDHRHNGLVLSSEAINIDNILEDDAFLSLALLDELLLDVLSQLCELFSTSSRLTLALTLSLSRNTGLLLLLGLLDSVVTLLVVSSDRLLVLLAHLIDVGANDIGWQLIHSVKLVQVGLSLVEEPREHLGFEGDLLELVVEESNVGQLLVRVLLQRLLVHFRDSASNHLFVGQLLSSLLLSLQVLFGFVGFKSEGLLFLKTLDIRIFKFVQVFELGLLALHFCELLLLEDLHAGLLQSLAAKDGEQGLYLILKQENFVIFGEGLF